MTSSYRRSRKRRIAASGAGSKTPPRREEERARTTTQRAGNKGSGNRRAYAVVGRCFPLPLRNRSRHREESHTLPFTGELSSVVPEPSCDVREVFPCVLGFATDGGP